MREKSISHENTVMVDSQGQSCVVSEVLLQQKLRQLRAKGDMLPADLTVIQRFFSPNSDGYSKLFNWRDTMEMVILRCEMMWSCNLQWGNAKVGMGIDNILTMPLFILLIH